MPSKDQTSTVRARQRRRTPGKPDRRSEAVRRQRLSTDIRVGKRGQIVLPAVIRRELGIEDGATLAVRADQEGRIVLEPVPSDPIERLRRALGPVYEGVDVDAYIRGLREEWDRE